MPRNVSGFILTHRLVSFQACVRQATLGEREHEQPSASKEDTQCHRLLEAQGGFSVKRSTFMRRGPKRKPINYRLTLPGSTSAASADSVPVPPLPVGQAVAALPGQYLRVLTRPSSGTFLEEKDKGSWALVWIQLLGSITLGIAVRLLIASTSTQGVTLNILHDQLLALVIGGPLLFFLSVGIQYGVARWLSAEKAGTYL